MNKKVDTFPQGVSSNLNIIDMLELELAYFEAAAQHFSNSFPGVSCEYFK